MPPYQAFLLTCWQEKTANAAAETWRFRLEEARTSEHHGFTNLADVMDFVQARLQAPDSDEAGGRPISGTAGDGFTLP